MLGTSLGSVQFWAFGGCSGAGPVCWALQQQVLCRPEALSPAYLDSDPDPGFDADGGGPGGPGGIVVAVALHPEGGCAAALTLCGQGDVEDGLYIWQATPRLPGCSGSSGCSSRLYAQEAALGLQDTATALAWLPCGLRPVLAVGYASGVGG